MELHNVTIAAVKIVLVGHILRSQIVLNFTVNYCICTECLMVVVIISRQSM